MKIPIYKQPLDENLSLRELIQSLNSDRARQVAEEQSGQLLTWDTLGAAMARAASTLVTS